MNIALLISFCGLACTVFGTWFGYRNGLKKDANAEGSLRSDVGYIKSSVDDVKREQKSFNKLHYDLAERVGKTEESVKSAHHRIDGLEERLK